MASGRLAGSRDPLTGLVDEALTLSVDDFWGQLRDRRTSTTLILGVVGAVGAIMLLLAQIGTTDFKYVPAQLPYLASGTLLGLALVGTALRLISVHLERVEAADERQQLEDIQRLALEVLGDVSDPAGSPRTP